jgi:Xaa-Pro aminopeptidase
VCFADQPDPHFRQMFTLVLKAHLDLATTKFPAGTSDSQLDGITRAALWRAGYDFGHGTGHGVGGSKMDLSNYKKIISGHFLNVHEIPRMFISFKYLYENANPLFSFHWPSTDFQFCPSKRGRCHN